MSLVTQTCSTPDCRAPAAYATRSNPSWCIDCLDAALNAGGLSACEPFMRPNDWWLTVCQRCGVQAHYRFDYILAKNRVKEAVCRACHWRRWASDLRARESQRSSSRIRELLLEYPEEEVRRAFSEANVRSFMESYWWPPERIRELLLDREHELISAMSEVNDGNDPVVGQCRRCSRIKVARVFDSWRCSCQQNTRHSNPASPTAGRMLLFDSQSPALKWWDSQRNDDAVLHTVTVRARRQCNWVCPDCGHQFAEKVAEMTREPSCPACRERRREAELEQYERWKTMSIADIPELLDAWDDDEDPRNVTVLDHWPSRRFRCASGHRPWASPLSFLRSGCPHCRGAETRRSNRRFLADLLPEIASQWHPTMNGRLTPANVLWNSARRVWWRANCCGLEWQDHVVNRDKYDRLRCPQCMTILGSLAWQDPGLAAEWSTRNPISAWHVRSHGATDFVPEWVCATNSEHVWQATTSARSNGAACPECRQTGKSKLELDHQAAAVGVFGSARSGVVVRSEKFQTRTSWTVDIAVDFSGRAVAIEYDGTYWHSAAAKVLVDEKKSKDLLAAGYAVVRLREEGLPSLPIANPWYREIRVYSQAPRPRAVMAEIADWLQGLTLRCH
jgi:hypothetical protein